MEDWDLLATDIQEKTPKEVKRYYAVFKKKWKQLSGMHRRPFVSVFRAHVIHVEHPRIEQRIVEGEAKRNKRSNLESLLLKKISSVKYPMQELELNYPTTKGKVYSEEEDRYLLCRLNYYGMTADDVYERIKKDITEFPVFRFDWFFKSRSPQELQRRCNTLLGMIEKEAEVAKEAEIKNKGGARGKVSTMLRYIYFSCMLMVQFHRNEVSMRPRRRILHPVRLPARQRRRKSRTKRRRSRYVT